MKFRVGKVSRRTVAFAGGLAVAAITAALYLSSVAPSVLTFGQASYDAASLQTRAYVLGIGHPTGYPTFILLGKLFTYLPVGEVAFRVSLSSAFYGILAVLFCYLTALRLTRRAGVSALAALLLAVGPGLWSQAVIAEVYTLNAAFISATLYVLVLWRGSGKEWQLLFAAFLCGLSLTNHMTSGLLLPAAAGTVFLVDRSKFCRPVFVIKAFGAFCLGLLPYAYLPLRAAMEPPMNYGEAQGPAGLWWLISGGRFGGRMFALAPGEYPERALLYLNEVWEQFPLPVLVFPLLGLAVLWRGNRAALVALAVVYFGTLAYAAGYDIPDIHPYFIPTYLVLALWLAVGASALLDYAEGPASLGLTGRTAARGLVLGLCAGVVLWSAVDTYDEVDLSDDDRGRQILSAIEREVEPDSVLMTQVNGGVIAYAIHVDPGRKDLSLVSSEVETVERARYSLRSKSPTYFLMPGEGNRKDLAAAGIGLEPVRGAREVELYRLRGPE